MVYTKYTHNGMEELYTIYWLPSTQFQYVNGDSIAIHTPSNICMTCFLQINLQEFTAQHKVKDT